LDDEEEAFKRPSPINLQPPPKTQPHPKPPKKKKKNHQNTTQKKPTVQVEAFIVQETAEKKRPTEKRGSMDWPDRP